MYNFKFWNSIFWNLSICVILVGKRKLIRFKLTTSRNFIIARIWFDGLSSKIYNQFIINLMNSATNLNSALTYIDHTKQIGILILKTSMLSAVSWQPSFQRWLGVVQVFSSTGMRWIGKKWVEYCTRTLYRFKIGTKYR